MKTHDIECPICGTINHNLYIEETDGWMECEKCGNAVQILKFAKMKKVPRLTGKELVCKFSTASA